MRPQTVFRSAVLALTGWLTLLHSVAQDAAQLERGKALYLKNCLLCHQVSGQGNPPTFPPLAGSDFLAADINRAIRALCEGLSGPIMVKGKAYNGTMPAQLVNDAEAADVLTYVLKSWGNPGTVVTAEQVARERAKTQFTTYEDLVKANAFAPLPKPPEGFTIREVTRLTNSCSRLLVEKPGETILALAVNGDIWRVEMKTGKTVRFLRADGYLEPQRGGVDTLGFCFDSDRRLYITCDRRIEGSPYVTNEVTIYRTEPLKGATAAQPKAWFKTQYPWGVGPFNHGVSCISQGPDGYMYVSSGSRTDGAEEGNDPHYSKGGEASQTACIWKLDPKQAVPVLSIFARGTRNPYGHLWDQAGRLLATDNGPNADAPEELNVIEAGKHYGFPFQFSNWTKKAYPYTPEPPAGITFQHPVANLGPAAGGTAEGLFTFDPHSSPAGLVQLDDSFPVGWRGAYLITRFGNLLQTPKDVGFDLVRADLTGDATSGWKAKMSTVLAPLARPLDIKIGAPGKLYILEYTRTTEFKAPMGFPGRILELAVVPAK